MINLRKEITEHNVKRNLDYAEITRDAKANVLYYWDELENTTFKFLKEMLNNGFVDSDVGCNPEITMDDVKYFTELVTNYLAESKKVEYPIVDGNF